MAADAECLLLAESVFKQLKIAVTIEVNNRKFLDGLLEDLGLPENKWVSTIMIIDKMKKIEQKQLEKELEENGLTKKQIETLLNYLLKTKGTSQEKLAYFRKVLKSNTALQGIQELEELFTHIPSSDKKKIIFTQTLARGLAYYTGTVFEVIPENESITSTIAGGGRYDKMIQQFLGSPQEYPAVGISFGLDRLSLIIQAREKEKVKTVTQIFVVSIDQDKECIHIAATLRENGIRTETDLLKRGPSKNLAYANSLGIPYVIFVGEDEVKSKKYKLKDMKTGKETVGKIEELIESVKE
jgi:histidyl-tRNA synthetase